MSMKTLVGAGAVNVLAECKELLKRSKKAVNQQIEKGRLFLPVSRVELEKELAELKRDMGVIS